MPTVVRTYGNFNVTSATGNGTTVTLTYASTPSFTFLVGSTISVVGMSPIGFNTASATVTASTPTTVSYLSAGSGTVTQLGVISQVVTTETVPTGATSVVVSMWGTGGNGAVSNNGSPALCGGGGAGGGYIQFTVAVVAGDTFTVSIGTASNPPAAPATAALSGTNGPATTVSGTVSGGTVTMSAAGGGGGGGGGGISVTVPAGSAGGTAGTNSVSGGTSVTNTAGSAGGTGGASVGGTGGASPNGSGTTAGDINGITAGSGAGGTSGVNSIFGCRGGGGMVTFTYTTAGGSNNVAIMYYQSNRLIAI